MEGRGSELSRETDWLENDREREGRRNEEGKANGRYNEREVCEVLGG